MAPGLGEENWRGLGEAVFWGIGVYQFKETSKLTTLSPHLTYLYHEVGVDI